MSQYIVHFLSFITLLVFYISSHVADLHSLHHSSLSSVGSDGYQPHVNFFEDTTGRIKSPHRKEVL
jgi:hypothetical protein